MDDLIRQANSILRAMWKHRWLGLAVAWLVGVIGAVAVLLVPDKYEASARIYVDTQSILKPLMSGLAVQPNVEQQIIMLSRTLISRPNVEKLIRMADLDMGSDNKGSTDALADRLIKGIQIKTAPQSTIKDNLYTIVYRDPDPEKAKRVVQSLLSIFVESSLGDSRKDSDSAKKFIDEQIVIYEKKLETAENRLKEFKLRNLEMQIDDGKGLANRLSEMGRELDKARLDLREAEHSRDAIKRQITGEDPVSLGALKGSGNNIPVPEIDSRIETQKANLDTLLQRYTEQHPDVVGARRMIKELEEQKRQEIADRGKNGNSIPSIAMSNNPVYQQLRISLAATEASVASLQTRVSEYEARQRRVNELMKSAPQVEAELAQLNRDYDVNRKNYEALVARRESASISGNLDTVAGAADFRLVDPPRVAPNPVAPNRLLLLPVVLILSLGAGAFACFAASRVRPVFFDALSLRMMTGLPLLGSVSPLETEAVLEGKRSDLKRFFIAFGGLPAAFAVGSIVIWATARTVVV